MDDAHGDPVRDPRLLPVGAELEPCAERGSRVIPMQPDEFDVVLQAEFQKADPAARGAAAGAEISVAHVRRIDERLKRNLVPVTAVSGALSLTPWEPARAVGHGLLLGSASLGVGAYAWASNRARVLARREAGALRAQRPEVALMFAMARSTYLSVLPQGRMRSALASVRAIEHGARSGNPGLVRRAAMWAKPTVAAVAGRSSKRLEDALHRVCEAIDGWEYPLGRAVGRIGLVDLLDAVKSPHLGSVLVDMGVDMYRTAEVFTSTLAVSDIEANMLRDLAGATLGGADIVDWALEQAREALTDGLAHERQRLGEAATDALVRSVIAKQVVPHVIVLHAYADAMDRTGDPRVNAFRTLLASGGQSQTPALAMIGFRRMPPGMDPLAR